MESIVPFHRADKQSVAHKRHQDDHCIANGKDRFLRHPFHLGFTRISGQVSWDITADISSIVHFHDICELLIKGAIPLNQNDYATDKQTFGGAPTVSYENTVERKLVRYYRALLVTCCPLKLRGDQRHKYLSLMATFPGIIYQRILRVQAKTLRAFFLSR